MVTPFFRQTYVTHHDNTSRAYESIAGGQQAFDNVRGLPYPGFAWMSRLHDTPCVTASKVLASIFASSCIVWRSRGRYSMYLLYIRSCMVSVATNRSWGSHRISLRLAYLVMVRWGIPKPMTRRNSQSFAVDPHNGPLPAVSRVCTVCLLGLRTIYVVLNTVYVNIESVVHRWSSIIR